MVVEGELVIINECKARCTIVIIVYNTKQSFYIQYKLAGETRLSERVKLAHIIRCAGEISRGSRGEYRRNGSVYLILWPRLQ